LWCVLHVLICSTHHTRMATFECLLWCVLHVFVCSTQHTRMAVFKYLLWCVLHVLIFSARSTREWPCFSTCCGACCMLLFYIVRTKANGHICTFDYLMWCVLHVFAFILLFYSCCREHAKQVWRPTRLLPLVKSLQMSIAAPSKKCDVKLYVMIMV